MPWLPRRTFAPSVRLLGFVGLRLSSGDERLARLGLRNARSLPFVHSFANHCIVHLPDFRIFRQLFSPRHYFPRHFSDSTGATTNIGRNCRPVKRIPYIVPHRHGERSSGSMKPLRSALQVDHDLHRSLAILLDMPIGSRVLSEGEALSDDCRGVDDL